MNKYLTDDCINCNKFSHCNNNDLICISKYKIKEQEYEKLKKRLESFQKDYSKLYQVVENKGYIKELDQLKAENDKRKQTLIDIKGIIEENFYFLDCDYRWILEQILQKIRECEVK